MRCFLKCRAIDRGLTDIELIKDRVKNLIFDDFIDPIDKDLKPIIENREGREKQLSEAQAKLNALLTQKKEYDESRYDGAVATSYHQAFGPNCSYRDRSQKPLPPTRRL